MVVPSALRVLRLKPGRKYCSLGRLSHEVGWKYQDVVETLEAKRRDKAEAYYKKASTVAKIRQCYRPYIPHKNFHLELNSLYKLGKTTYYAPFHPICRLAVCHRPHRVPQLRSPPLQ